jgi:hypothetical protein
MATKDEAEGALARMPDEFDDGNRFFSYLEDKATIRSRLFELEDENAYLKRVLKTDAGFHDQKAAVEKELAYWARQGYPINASLIRSVFAQFEVIVKELKEEVRELREEHHAMVWSGVYD